LVIKVAECVKNNDLEKLVVVDTQFHDVLYRASRNDRLVQMINHLRENIQRYRMISMGTPGRMRETLEEHKQMVEAITARDVELARRVAQEHIENAENCMMEAIREQMRSCSGRKSQEV